MTSPLLPPNPCLVAILLVVNYHHQPRLVFHYPPRPGEDNTHITNYLKSDLTDDESTSSNEDDSSSASNGHLSAKGDDGEKRNSEDALEVDVEEAGSASPEKLSGLAFMQRQARWDDILGYGAVNLAKLLCPASSAHKRRFEMSLNDKSFLGWPLFSRDGNWQKKRKEKRPRSGDLGLEDKAQSGHRDQGNTAKRKSVQIGEELEEMSGQDTDLDSQHHTHVMGEANSPTGRIREDTCKQKKTKEEYSKDTLKMFHVVFVLDPPPCEYHLRMNEMYGNVIKKFSRALKWEQVRTSYVSKEVSTISAASKGYHKKSGQMRFPFSVGILADSHSLGPAQPLATMYQQLLSQSSLAKAISTLFTSITDSRIAHVHLTPALSLSLQIPVPTSTSILPSPVAPHLPGLWLTTANSLPSDDDINATTSQLASHFTLLLLSDLSSILSDVNATNSPLTEPLTHYLRVSTYTKSFVQISQSSGIPLPDIQFLASHLIYWRRARAIPPIHQRDTYIVSPNADMQKLVSASSAFAKAFPNLPSLPRILSTLSFPRPYNTVIPTKDHKQAYLQILAWLLRYGWVTQLRTFGWIKVPPHIKEIVATQPEEVGEKSSEKQVGTSTDATGGLKPVPSNQLLPPSPASSNRTISPILPSTISPSIIPNPRHASALPSRHLAAISNYVLEQQGKEARVAWDKCVGYFDGKHALEIIPVRQSWNRKKVTELLAGWEGLGILIRARHW